MSDEIKTEADVYAFLVREERKNGCTCEQPPMVVEEQEDGTRKAVLTHFEGCPRAYGLTNRN